ncbi:MAG: F0F1 ATP synthase subunit alpha [Anaerolineae bacterium]|jgi:F-type H+-transporting ATPase subunit alpha
MSHQNHSEENQLDIPALVEAIQEQVESQEAEARVRELTLPERVRHRISEISARPDSEAGLRAVVRTLRKQAAEQKSAVILREVGTVQHIGDGVATLSGLPLARTDELVEFPTGVRGLILNLDHARLDVILLGPDEGIQGGDLVTATGERVRVPVGHQLPGRVVNPLGEPLDDRGPVQATEVRFLDREAPDIVERAPVNEPLYTGTKIVDALLPIGRGQRELILGDRQVGKTSLAVDAVLSQRDRDVSCVYVSIGQKKSSALSVIETLRRHNALAHTTVVVASPEDPPALRYLAPYTGCTIAEFFKDEGRDALIVYDDLNKHADAYRELSLLLRRPPGREAYPGDIFYIHARLLERACKLGETEDGGSLTALPIVVTQRGNVSAYIPTNLISICDGQIVLDTDLYNQGIKPAVDVGLSVSRVGGEAQSDAMREVAGELRLELSQYDEVRRFARFGAEVDESTRRQIEHGRRLRAALKQPVHHPLPLAFQIVILLTATEGLLDSVTVEEVPAFERGLLELVQRREPELLHQINRTGELLPDTREALMGIILDYAAEWSERRSEP